MASCQDGSPGHRQIATAAILASASQGPCHKPQQHEQHAIVVGPLRHPIVPENNWAPGDARGASRPTPASNKALAGVRSRDLSCASWASAWAGSCTRGWRCSGGAASYSLVNHGWYESWWLIIYQYIFIIWLTDIWLWPQYSSTNTILNTAWNTDHDHDDFNISIFVVQLHHKPSLYSTTLVVITPPVLL